LDTARSGRLSTPRHKLSLCRSATKHPCGVCVVRDCFHEFNRTSGSRACAPAVASFCLLAHEGGASAAPGRNVRAPRARSSTAPHGRSSGEQRGCATETAASAAARANGSRCTMRSLARNLVEDLITLCSRCHRREHAPLKHLQREPFFNRRTSRPDRRSPPVSARDAE
jgi:hypothetical protein